MNTNKMRVIITVRIYLLTIFISILAVFGMHDNAACSFYPQEISSGALSVTSWSLNKQSAPSVLAQMTSRQKTMPNLIGMTVEQAKATLKNEGISNYWVSFRWTAEQSEDRKVYAQHPEPGRPAFEAVIYYNIFEQKSVPNVVGLSYSEAIDILMKVGLDFKEVIPGVQTPDERLYGRVARQDPPAGSTVSRRTTSISLSLYKKDVPFNVTVPSVIGMDMVTANRVLEQAGLAYKIKGPKHASDGNQNLKIISQNPPAGSRMDGGSTIQLELWEYPQVAVPNVVGRRLADAEAALRRVGLKMAVVEKSIGQEKSDGLIRDQDQPAGRTVAMGTTITLTAYRFDPSQKDQITMPLLIGLTYDKAITILAYAGLKWKKVECQTRNRIRHARVASQNPKSGSKVAKGTTVQIDVYRFRNSR